MHNSANVNKRPSSFPGHRTKCDVLVSSWVWSASGWLLAIWLVACYPCCINFRFEMGPVLVTSHQING